MKEIQSLPVSICGLARHLDGECEVPGLMRLNDLQEHHQLLVVHYPQRVYVRIVTFTDLLGGAQELRHGHALQVLQPVELVEHVDVPTPLRRWHRRHRRVVLVGGADVVPNLRLAREFHGRHRAHAREDARGGSHEQGVGVYVPCRGHQWGLHRRGHLGVAGLVRHCLRHLPNVKRKGPGEALEPRPHALPVKIQIQPAPAGGDARFFGRVGRRGGVRAG
mmetsp:Transcript_44295/g.60518  ORF Transcript_44295/g.60518 Transcript_44295/m.60518 type:complete len:220 (+) Transcript_44295:2810-3469(+)